MQHVSQWALRLFVAVTLPQSTKQALHKQVAVPLAKACAGKASRLENLHITIKFLGDVAAKDVPALGAALQSAFCGQLGCAVATGPPGWFGRRDAATAWVGLSRGQSEIAALMRRCDQALSALNFPQETKGYHPHITVARQVRAAALEKLEFPSFAFVANNLTLMQSLRVDGRLTYRPLCTVALDVRKLR